MPPAAAANRQRRHAWVSQFAQHQFALELQCDHEKEQRHQGVVDPTPQRAGGLQRPDPDADGQLPEGQKLIGPRGIGQDQGSDGDHQEDCAARSLDAQKRRKRLRQAADRAQYQLVELDSCHFIRSIRP
jgi:hypothetical protein